MLNTIDNRFHVGDKATYSKTITETDVLAFAAITGDLNPVHTNKEYAAKSVFKKQIAHGGYISALFSTVLGTKLPGEGTIYMEQDSRFVRPVYFGDTITAEVEVSEVISDKNRLLLKTIAYNQNHEPVVTGHALVMVR